MNKPFVWFLPVVVVMAGIFVISSKGQPPAAGFDVQRVAVAGHLLAYGVLAVALLVAFEHLGWPSRRAAVWAFLGAVMYGLSDEVHQYFVPGRNADPFDLLIDAVGAAAALWVFTSLREQPRLSVRRWVLTETRRRA